MKAGLIAKRTEMQLCHWEGLAPMHGASHLTIDDLCAAPTLELQGSFCLSSATLLHSYLTEVIGCM